MYAFELFHPLQRVPAVFDRHVVVLHRLFSVEQVTPLFHLVYVSTFVVVLLDNVCVHVGAFSDLFGGSVSRSPIGDAPFPNGVWCFGAWALASIIDCTFHPAVVHVFSVRTFPGVEAGLREFVYLSSKS